MSYSVSDQNNARTGEAEYIVIDCNGTKAPPPHGGPFLSRAEAAANCELLKKLSVEDWFALYPERTRNEHVEGIGSVWHISPDGQWIQHKGRNTFTVHPQSEFDPKIGRVVTVDKTGEIAHPDRALGHSKGR